MDRILDQRYRILEPIGAGGSSQVYLAQDTALGREVAVKVLDPQAAADGTLRKLFVKEGRALAQLTHPNIVAVYDVGEVDGLPFIVMEHVAGSSLKQRIERSGALPLDDAVRLTDEIANGLAFAHSRGIIHADLKPSNILLDQNDQPKICDFGIARTPAEDSDSPQLFATALYVAPERVEGRPASVASDIYGLGLVVYEMLVGKPPFTSGNAAVLLRDHVVRPPVPPSHLRPSLPKEVDSIVLKALAKDPALRYHKATDIGEALTKMLQTHTAATAASTHSFDDYAPNVMTEPLRGFVPRIEQSPVVALLTTYGQPIRRAFYGVLAALPLFGLTILAGFGLIPAAFMAAIVLVVGFLGQLGLALTIGWVIETVLLFLFVPGLALIWVVMGLWVWLRDVSAERTAMAIAMPATAPFGLAPALVFSASAIHGLGGVVTVVWGAAMTMVFAIASGRQSLGAFVQSGLSLQQESLFSAGRDPGGGGEDVQREPALRATEHAVERRAQEPGHRPYDKRRDDPGHDGGDPRDVRGADPRHDAGHLTPERGRIEQAEQRVEPIGIVPVDGIEQRALHVRRARGAEEAVLLERQTALHECAERLPARGDREDHRHRRAPDHGHDAA
ncbi:MAG TPA: serine/threonine-protein kinase, partial [Candidatus Limnocylindria bacterium]